MITRKTLCNYIRDSLNVYLPSDMSVQYADETTTDAKQYNCAITIKALSGDIQANVMNYPVNIYFDVEEMFFDEVLNAVYSFVEDFCDNQKVYTITDPVSKEKTSVYFDAKTPYVPETKIQKGITKINQIVVMMNLSTVGSELVVFDETNLVKFELTYLEKTTSLIHKELLPECMIEEIVSKVVKKEAYLHYDEIPDDGITRTFIEDGVEYTEYVSYEVKSAEEYDFTKVILCSLGNTHTYQQYTVIGNITPKQRPISISTTLRIDYIFDKTNLIHKFLADDIMKSNIYTIKYINGTGKVFTFTAKVIDYNELNQRGAVKQCSAQFIVEGVEENGS